MDAVSFALGVLPLCIEPYKFIAAAKGAGKEFAVYRNMFMLEELRLTGVGQRLGLLSFKHPTEVLSSPGLKYQEDSFPRLCELLKPHLQTILDIIEDEREMNRTY